MTQGVCGSQPRRLLTGAAWLWATFCQRPRAVAGRSWPRSAKAMLRRHVGSFRLWPSRRASSHAGEGGVFAACRAAPLAPDSPHALRRKRREPGASGAAARTGTGGSDSPLSPASAGRSETVTSRNGCAVSELTGAGIRSPHWPRPATCARLAGKGWRHPSVALLMQRSITPSVCALPWPHGLYCPCGSYCGTPLAMTPSCVRCCSRPRGHRRSRPRSRDRFGSRHREAKETERWLREGASGPAQRGLSRWSSW